MHRLQIVHICIHSIVPVTLHILKCQGGRKDGQQKSAGYSQVQQEVEPSFD